ncbi:alpha-L-arabinofuranosidase C-terminal domain-containing protein [Bifidobacterium vespertilionis]|uniref:non-reducing end alpha-L-arabinofuranosidase n=1 Tax=Bifidobacterium vespertilionis TaxID=2562524 RepID=A0A5J5DY70_9BIFI|nr:alpha-L-arabinofuranosidase C-terminal domain-containing protein [Bifidobacterium vespertilionis]KAA8816788.1 alpha-L-arabinofuranosidase [Bifidobacterium vespertilionis]KAA8821847.1 alpha-L-arabinofuranosidase [Bifidobacterium vespertilionis]
MTTTSTSPQPTPAATDRLFVKSRSGEARAISTDLWGIFFEDISSCADGGLASELVRNGAFEFSRRDGGSWGPFTGWTKTVPAGSAAAFAVSTSSPLAVENPHYVIAEIAKAPAYLDNAGYDGVTFTAGERYEFSIWAKVERDLDGGAPKATPIDVTLLDDAGDPAGGATVTAEPGDGEWHQLHASFEATASAKAGRIRLTFAQAGVVAIDFVSLEPARTSHGLKHMRADLVDVLADLHPRFMRFPGGCVAHGGIPDNMYRWKDSVGPVEHRRQDYNLWGYHQSKRIGYLEYLELCEALGMEPLPVLPAGVCCQNADGGPIPIPVSEMDDYIREVLDLIDFCNGDETTEWGAKRIAWGHPKPFNLKYLGIGNEDKIDAVFEDRFGRIFDAVRREHPEIVVVGTVGPAPFGSDYDEGWRYATEAGVPIVDEHSYQAPSWWFKHLDHYDHANRKGPKVYLGEYGSWGTTLLNALSEAAIMGRIELNGDVVHMASYAPLFCKNGHAGWNPNLIYFDNEHIYRTNSYWVQRMFGLTPADVALPVDVEGDTVFDRPVAEQAGVAFGGASHARIRNIVLTDADGVEHPIADLETGSEVSGAARFEDCGVHVDSSSYSVRFTLEYLGSKGYWDNLGVRLGDVSGRDHYEFRIGQRNTNLVIVNDGFASGYADPVSYAAPLQAGDVLEVELHVEREGGHVVARVNGGVVADAREDGVREVRRTVSVVRRSSTSGTADGFGCDGVTYIRVVNAMAEPVRVELKSVLADVLDMPIDRPTAEHPAPDLSAVPATILTGDPDSGKIGAASPNEPRRFDADLTGCAYTAPAWSFTVIELHD